MNKQEKLAREWAEKNYPEFVKAAEGTLAADLFEKAKAAAEYILEHTALETMEGVEWDDEKHHLAGATTPRGDVVMMWPDEDAGDIVTSRSAWRRDQLTPNGKRYKLVEVTGPDYPEVLESYADFRDAPVGTIVAKDTFAPWLKTSADSWTSAYGEAVNIGMAARPGTFHVLRWGDEA
ncbi:hypothetical protein QP968_00565 [Corynebacterium sp. MSK041]|uniref:hypothetical protein n=1 Tax=Corynebacterium sp. MSK041 TaxID=3050194 RepID=UPI00254B40A7|nr:hypothetical protein [Corynebacterium sp. MSK041]MDK8794205.1 hypothetical protein [Corynebacterium sp. MSK041]